MRSSYWWTEPHTIVALKQERVSITYECRWFWVRPTAMQRRQLRYGLPILRKVTSIHRMSKRARGKGISYYLIFVDILQILQGWCTSTLARYRQSKWGYFTGTSCYTCTTISVLSHYEPIFSHYQYISKSIKIHQGRSLQLCSYNKWATRNREEIDLLLLKPTQEIMKATCSLFNN